MTDKLDVAISNLKARIISNPSEARLAVEQFMEDWPQPENLRRSSQPFGSNTWYRFMSGNGSSERRIIHVHGGGFTSGSGRSYGAMLGELTEGCQAEAISCDYRLAPEHPFPAGLEDVEASLHELLHHDWPKSTAVVADSAGAALAVAAISRMAPDRRPAAVVLFSPLLDLASEGGSMLENESTDKMFSAHQLQVIQRVYARDVSLLDPNVSPLYGSNLGEFPPVLVFASDHEVLRDNAVRFHEAIRESGGSSELRLVPDVPHAWPTFGASVPDSAEALTETTEFINNLITTRGTRRAL